jgi:MFS family permease
MALSFVILTLASEWHVMLLAAGIFGVGFGMHAGVNVALAVAFVPSSKESGTFLGVLQDAIFLALIVSPQIGGGILTTFPQQFALLFGAGAVVSLLAGATLLPLLRFGWGEQQMKTPLHTRLEE